MFSAKKGQEQTIINILLVLVGMAILVSLIIMVLQRGGDTAIENACRASVVLRDRQQHKVDLWITDVEVDKYTPLLCATQEKEIPKSKKDDKGDVMKQIADQMVRCRWQFGDGVIKDIFAEGGRGFDNECMVCYLVTTDTKSGSEFDEIIPAQEFYEFLINTPYLVESDADNCYVGGGGYCMESAQACMKDERFAETYDYIEDAGACKSIPNKPVCCYSTLECVRKGGECLMSGETPKQNQVRYPGWSCDEEKECFIDVKNRYTYSEYLQFYKGYSTYVVAADIKPDSTYAIAWGSPNEDDCEWCEEAMAVGAVIGLGAAIVVTGGGAGVVALTIYAAGTVGGAALGGAGQYAIEIGIRDIEELLMGRNQNTIYFYEYAGKGAEVCNVVNN